MEHKKINSFSELTSINELMNYLDSAARLKDSNYVYQYTNISSFISMMDSGTIHLCNAKYMNDQLEYNNGDERLWKDLFFTCFMLEDEESIGMWSMYAQPWRDGIKISIPKDVLRKWVSEVERIEEIDLDSKKPTGRNIDNSNDFKVWLSAVAYTDADRINRKKEAETLHWGTLKNQNFTFLNKYDALTGYLKDIAWAYEKEIRLKLKINRNHTFKRIAIKIPDYVINSMIITPSPLFDGDFKEALETKIQKHFETKDSTFKGKLTLKDKCSDCSLKGRYDNEQ